MPDDTNRLVLEGFLGPATVRTDASGTLLARAYLSVRTGARRFSILVRATGDTAARLADCDAADVVRILGKLAWDPLPRRHVVEVLQLRFTGREPSRKRKSVATLLTNALETT